MEVSVVPVTSNKNARKRIRNPQNWKKNIEKRQRYSAHSLPNLPTCEQNKNTLKCATLTYEDVQNFHSKFYAKSSRDYQNEFVLKYTKMKEIKRRRPRNNLNKEKQCSVKYEVRAKNGKCLPVCARAFCTILGMSYFRINNLCKQFFERGVTPSESRGGDRKAKKNIGKLNSVMQFISEFKCIESHYCRSDSSARMYLPSDLSIRTMYHMYQKQNINNEELKVNESYFRTIFNTKFNLGFGSPRTDVCSMCLSNKYKISKEKDQQRKNQIITAQRVHRLRANAFYEYLREKRSDLITLSFDCQKNQCLPKVPDQSAYYSRQFYMYNFAIVEGSSHDHLKNKVSLYYWTENSRPKGSNEICSAVYNNLCNIRNDNNIHTVRLIADGCSGQNKNTSMICMCSKWLAEAPKNIRFVEIIFPVVGHSFIPPDRVFGLIEKEIRKREQIIEVVDYLEIFEKYGKIYELGSNNMPIYDWKEQSRRFMKPTTKWHFKFLHSKRFILKRTQNNRIFLRGEPHYKNDVGEFQSVFHKNKSAKSINPSVLPIGVAVSSLKINDVKKLLQNHFGENWVEQEELKFYKNIIFPCDPVIILQEGEDDCECDESIKESPDLFV